MLYIFKNKKGGIFYKCDTIEIMLKHYKQDRDIIGKIEIKK